MDKTISSILEKQLINLETISDFLQTDYHLQDMQTVKINDISDSLEDTYLLQVEQFDTLSNIEKLSEIIANGGIGTSFTSEEKSENIRREERTNSLLEQIAKNIGLLKDKEEDDKPEKTDNSGLGGLLSGIAVAIAALGGIVIATVNRIRFFLNLLSPSLYKKFANGIETIVTFFAKIGSEIKSIFNVAFTALKSVLSSVMEAGMTELRKLFTFNADSGIGKIITAFKTAITKFIEPFADAIKAIQELASGSGTIGKIISYVTDTLGSIGSKFMAFGAKIGKLAKIFGRLFLPVEIIMTLWDTVSGMIEGYEKGGIIGAFTGAVKGFFDSIIMAPLDALKSIVSWVAELFGFDSISKALDSFSFVELFDSLFDTIPAAKKAFFDSIKNAFQTVVDTIGDWFSSIGDGLLSALEGIGIPEFTIPIPEWMGGPITLGPWYPFKSEKIPESNKETEKAPTTSKKEDKPVPKQKNTEYIPNGEIVKEEKGQSPKTQPSSIESTNVANVAVKGQPTRVESTNVDVKGQPTRVESTNVANEAVIKGQPLSDKQMAVSEMSMKMGNKLSPEVQAAYDLKKKEPTRVEPIKKEISMAEQVKKPEEKSWWNKPLFDKKEPTQIEKFLEPSADQVKKPEEKSWWNKPLFDKKEPTQIEKFLEPTKIEPDKESKPEISKPWWAFSFGDEEKAKDISPASSMFSGTPKTSGVDYIMKPEVESPITSAAVYNKSAENIGSKEDMTSSKGGNTIVSAPTGNTNNQTVNKNTVKVSAINQDRTYSSYMKYVVS